MLHLELKIPPLVVVIICAGLMALCAQYLPSVAVPITLKAGAVGLLVFSGLAIALLGIYSFFSAKTTVNPHTPRASTSLVTTGVYEYTRNPMYMAFLLWLIACAVYSSTVYSFLLLPFFVWYLGRYQIQPEEKVLEELFGADFIDYKKRVRRWL